MKQPKRTIKEAFLSLKDDILEYKTRERTFILVESIITFVTAYIAMIINFVGGRNELGFITLVIGSIMFVFAIIEFLIFSIYNKNIKNLPFLYANFLLSYILVIFYLIFAPKDGIHLYWIVSLPIVFTIVGGIKHGTTNSLNVLFIIILFFYVPPFQEWMKGDLEEGMENNFDAFRIFFIVNYVMTVFIGSVVALINDVIIKKLNILKEDYYRDANTDITTGLKNQMYFLSYVKDLSTQLEVGDTIGLMFIDIDDFKVYNDRYGHTVGNKVLVKVANKLNEVPHSLLVRWGGDEFAIIERNITKDEFVAKANYLLKSVEGSGGVTISIGLAFYNVDENFDFDTIFNEADMKAIRAKGKGKNCIVIND